MIGLGNVGLLYDLSDVYSLKTGQCMTHCKAIADSHNFHLCSISDLDSVRESIAKSIYNISRCDSRSLQLGVVCTPTSSHHQIVKELIENSDVRSILIEKPAGVNSQECRNIQTLCDDNNVQVYVNYFRRILSGTLAARSYFTTLKLGKLTTLRIRGYGDLINIFSHFVDLAFWLTRDGILCMCRKKMKKSFDGAFEYTCNDCSTSYLIEGLGSEPGSCEIEYTFENLHLLVSDSGKRFSFSNGKDDMELFETGNAEYFNYQSVVMSNIEKCSDLLSGLSQAIQVHEFLESMEFE